MLQPCQSLLASRVRRAFLCLGAGLVSLNALAQTPASHASAPAEVCPALQRIVAAPDWRAMVHDGAGLPGLEQATCTAHAGSLDCRWRAHWDADGTVSDPLEELGADIAACFPQALHDVNTPRSQHFKIRTPRGIVGMRAALQGQRELRLSVSR